MAKGMLHLVLLIFGTLALNATDLSAAFDQANKLYEQAKYPEAVSAYEKLVQQNTVSAALYFNLGNALFKTGKIGEAILNYRLAERLAPRDPDIQANLQFARAGVNGGTTAASARWKHWLSVLTLNELAVIAMLSAWIWFFLLILKQLRPPVDRSLSGYTATAGGVTLLVGLWIGILWNARFRTEAAVIVVTEAVVRYGPLDESQSFYTLHDGGEVIVLNHLNDWLQVQDAAQRIGWVQLKQVAILPPG
jgi:tetratricopeptide (TPR) repeat protein